MGNVNTSETVRASVKMRDMTFTDLVFLSRDVTADAVIHDLDLNVQCHKFETLTSWKR